MIRLGLERRRRWGFIGSGKMATALIKGMLRAGIAPVDAIRASDPLLAARTLLEAETGVTVYDSNLPVVQQSDVVVLAVKPQSMRQVLENLRPVVTPEHLVVSVAAGITIASITQWLLPGVRVIRVMPNTPALLAEGASAYAPGPGVSPEDERVVKSFLDSVGQTVGVAESLLDAVTGLSGSGPAFVYLMIEALSDGGVRVGLPRNVATLLASQTVLGAARMVGRRVYTQVFSRTRSRHPAAQRLPGCMLSSEPECAERLMDAVEAATRRSAELAALATPPGASPAAGTKR